MEAEWEPVLMDIVACKETGMYIVCSGEETAQMLDGHIVMTQAMSFSPYKKPFEGCDEEWALCRRSWLYLEPIFSLEDIIRQLPVEGKCYQTMDRIWRRIMASAQQDPKVSSTSPAV